MPRNERHIPHRLLLAGTAFAITGLTAVVGTRGSGEETVQAIPPAMNACRPGQTFSPSRAFHEDIGIKLYETLLPNPAYRGFLAIETGGSFALVECPYVVAIRFSPSSDGRVVIRDDPSRAGKETYELRPESIHTRYGTLVFGHPFPTNDDGPGAISVVVDGKTIKGGLWFMLTDIEGNPVHPTNGRVLRPPEGAYYTAGTFVGFPPKPTDETQL